MHRTRTTARVLVGVAVAAVSGCVSVAPPTGGPAPLSQARPAAQDVAPQIVEGPAKEALEAALPDRDSPRAADGPPGGEATPSRAAPEPEPAPATPSVRTPRDEQRRPHLPEMPDLPPDVRLPDAARLPAGGAGLCPLGKKYGGWQPHSPQARICEDTYGTR
ncbi:hypothetical protein [Streptomyces purpureus]|uniref:Lipoprotein n=1 Tax=Streptomyces purpureus TaxID=1951 RepID=A0A918LS84_9ACTN|nr:hypothetical protein [Streptomyces purpureus]GGT42126.1 lipoprotein [Streptomyces purpureus]